MCANARRRLIKIVSMKIRETELFFTFWLLSITKWTKWTLNSSVQHLQQSKSSELHKVGRPRMSFSLQKLELMRLTLAQYKCVEEDSRRYWPPSKARSILLNTPPLLPRVGWQHHESAAILSEGTTKTELYLLSIFTIYLLFFSYCYFFIYITLLLFWFIYNDGLSARDRSDFQNLIQHRTC